MEEKGRERHLLNVKFTINNGTPFTWLSMACPFCACLWPLKSSVLSLWSKMAHRGQKHPVILGIQRELPFSQVLRGRDCIIRVAYLSKWALGYHENHPINNHSSGYNSLNIVAETGKLSPKSFSLWCTQIAYISQFPWQRGETMWLSSQYYMGRGYICCLQAWPITLPAQSSALFSSPCLGWIQ